MAKSATGGSVGRRDGGQRRARPPAWRYRGDGTAHAARALDGTGGLAAQAQVLALGRCAAAQAQARVAAPVQRLGHGHADDRAGPHGPLELVEAGEAPAHAPDRLGEWAAAALARDGGLEAGRRLDAQPLELDRRRQDACRGCARSGLAVARGRRARRPGAARRSPGVWRSRPRPARLDGERAEGDVHRAAVVRHPQRGGALARPRRRWSVPLGPVPSSYWPSPSRSHSCLATIRPSGSVAPETNVTGSPAVGGRRARSRTTRPARGSPHGRRRLLGHLTGSTDGEGPARLAVLPALSVTRRMIV